jgi:hypothetical protein
MNDEPLATFLAAGPWPQRQALRLLVQVGRRRRGARLLQRHAPLASQLVTSLTALADYDRLPSSRALGFDPEVVVRRGRWAQQRQAQPEQHPKHPASA